MTEPTSLAPAPIWSGRVYIAKYPDGRTVITYYSDGEAGIAHTFTPKGIMERKAVEGLIEHLTKGGK